MTRSAFVAGAVATAAALAAAAPAAAGDSWAGFSAGLHTGGDWQNGGFAGYGEQVTQFTNAFVPGRGLVIVPGTTVQVAAQSHRQSRWEWGGQVGYTARINPSWVAGIEGDVDSGAGAVRAASSANLPPTAIESTATVAVSRTIEARWLWSVRAKVGFTADRFEVYGTGGVAGGDLRATAFDTFISAGGLAANCAPGPCQSTTGPVSEANGGAATAHRVGWTAGAGAGVAVTEHVNVSLEYRHTDLGSQVWGLPNTVITSQLPAFTDPPGASNAGALPPAAVVTPQRISYTNDAITVRFNYRFGS
jgi:opacity protein-like surface antigen